MNVAFPAIGGLLIAAAGPAVALGADAPSYAAAAALISSIRAPLQPPPQVRAATGGLIQRTRGDICEGLRFLWREPVVRAFSFLGFGQSVAAGAVMSLLVVLAVQDLHLPAKSGLSVLVFIAIAVGGLVGGISLPLMTKYAPIGWISITAFASNAVLLAAIVTTRAAPAVLTLLTLVGGLHHRHPERDRYPTTAYSGPSAKSPEHHRPHDRLGRRTRGCPGRRAIAAATDVHTAYLAAAAAIGATAIAALFSPLRHRSLTTACTTKASPTI